MIEINKPVINPELLESMNKFLEDKSAVNELILIERIYQAKLLTPVIVDDDVENDLIEEGSTVSFKTITNTNDEAYFIAFTDWDELGKWSKEKEQTLIYTCEDLNGIAVENIDTIKGFVINPYSQRFIITPEVMKYFSQRKSEIVAQGDSKIMLGQPAEYPNELVNAMSKFFESCLEVKSAYLFLACKEGDKKSNLLFVIDFVCEKDVLFPKIAAKMQKYMGKGEYFDMITMASSLGTSAVKNASPFYKKKN